MHMHAPEAGYPYMGFGLAGSIEKAESTKVSPYAEIVLDYNAGLFYGWRYLYCTADPAAPLPYSGQSLLNR
jgi:hypothetical protein